MNKSYVSPIVWKCYKQSRDRKLGISGNSIETDETLWLNFFDVLTVLSKTSERSLTDLV